MIKPVIDPLTGMVNLVDQPELHGRGGGVMGGGGGGASVSDDAYGMGWDGVTDVAPSKNAVYDKIQTIVAGGGTGVVEAIVPGTNIDVDSTDPANPVVSVENLTTSDISDVTASAAELNILDGATLTTSELNHVDGVTSAIQTQLDARVLKAGDTMTGALGIGAAASGTQLHVSTGTATNYGLLIKGVTSQSAYLTEWRDVSNSELASVRANGDVFGTRLLTSGSLLANTYGSYTGAGVDWQIPTGSRYLLGTTGTLRVVNNSNVAFAEYQVGASPYVKLTSLDATFTPLAVKGATSQTANLQEWQNSSGTVMSAITLGGAFVSTAYTSHSFGAAQSGGALVTMTAPNAAELVLRVRATTSQTADLQQWQDSGGTSVVRVAAGGNFISTLAIYAPGLSNGSTSNNAYVQVPAAGALITTALAANVALRVQNVHATPTANLQQWLASDGAVLAKITSAGKLNIGTPATYTPTNVTTDRSYDANATSVDELADVVGSLIADLQATGLIG